MITVPRELIPVAYYLLYLLIIGCVDYFFQFKKRRLEFPWLEVGAAILAALLATVLRKGAAKYLPFSFTDYFYDNRFLTFEINYIWKFALVLLIADFLYYWSHRASHQINLFWLSHSVHHLPKNLTPSVAFQQGWLGTLISSYLLISIPLALLGVHPRITFMCYGLILLYQAWIHTTAIPRLGFLEKIINTPSHHQVHHSTSSGFENKNFGGILIIFDKLFGTFKEAPMNYTFEFGIKDTPKIKSLFSPIVFQFSLVVNLLKQLKNARSMKSLWAILIKTD